MIALAAISFGSVYTHAVTPVKSSMQTDTTKKKKDKPGKKDTTKTKGSMKAQKSR